MENAQNLVGNLIEKASEIQLQTQENINNLKEEMKQQLITPASLTEEQIKPSQSEEVDATIEKLVQEPVESYVQLEEESNFNKEFKNLVFNSETSADKPHEEAETIKNTANEINININNLHQELEAQIQESIKNDEEVVLEVQSLPEAAPEVTEEIISEKTAPAPVEETKQKKDNSFFSSCSIL